MRRSSLKCANYRNYGHMYLFNRSSLLKMLTLVHSLHYTSNNIFNGDRYYYNKNNIVKTVNVARTIVKLNIYLLGQYNFCSDNINNFLNNSSHDEKENNINNSLKELMLMMINERFHLCCILPPILQSKSGFNLIYNLSGFNSISFKTLLKILYHITYRLFYYEVHK